MWIENLILVKNLGNIITNENYWYEKIVEEHKKQLGNSQRTFTNFSLNDSFSEFSNNLTKTFHEISENEYAKIYGNYKLASNNSDVCWAYVTNCDDYHSLIHDHARTSTINAVFYFNVPSNISGGLTFYRSRSERYLTYYPKNNDLLIFPNHLLHRPEKSDSKKYRISINMEIKCEFV